MLNKLKYVPFFFTEIFRNTHYKGLLCQSDFLVDFNSCNRIIENSNLKKFQKEEGEFARRKISYYTRYLTLFLSLIQSFFFISFILCCFLREIPLWVLWKYKYKKGSRSSKMFIILQKTFFFFRIFFFARCSDGRRRRMNNGWTVVLAMPQVSGRSFLFRLSHLGVFRAPFVASPLLYRSFWHRLDGADF